MKIPEKTMMKSENDYCFYAESSMKNLTAVFSRNCIFKVMKNRTKNYNKIIKTSDDKMQFRT
jgi:hypothetical protein